MSFTSVRDRLGAVALGLITCAALIAVLAALVRLPDRPPAVLLLLAACWSHAMLRGTTSRFGYAGAVRIGSALAAVTVGVLLAAVPLAIPLTFVGVIGLAWPGRRRRSEICRASVDPRAAGQQYVLRLPNPMSVPRR